MTSKFSRVFIVCIAAIALMHCKDASSKKRNNNNDDNRIENGDFAGDGSRGGVGPDGRTSGAPGITLGGQASGSVIQVNNRDLGAQGGLSIRVTGLNAQTTLVGFASQEIGELVISGSAGQFVVSGSLPYGVTTPISINLLARDSQRCQGSVCNQRPDGRGVWPAQAAQPQQGDVQAQFSVQLGDNSTGNSGGLGGLLGGNNGNGGGGILSRIYQYLAQLIRGY